MARLNIGKTYADRTNKAGALFERGIEYLISGLLLIACMSCDFSSKQDLIRNYEKNQLDIQQLHTYVNEKTSGKRSIRIEFTSDKKIAYFYIVVNGIHVSADGDYNGDFAGNRNIDIESPYVDNLLKRLGWTRDDLMTLKQILNKANCISVISGDPTTIGYKRAGFGLYSYVVFNQALSDSLKHQYNDGCRYIFYRDNVVLEYGGGVIGYQCF